MNVLLFEFSSLCIVLWILILVLILLYLFGRFYFFEKIGIDGWKGLVPLYSDYLYFAKAGENPKLPLILFFSYLFFVICDEYFINFIEIRGMFLFLKSLIIVIGLIFSWNVNFYISNKMKCNYMLTIALTFFPIIAIPAVGLSNKFKWSRLVKMNRNFLSNDFYLERKITVADVFISNFISSILTILILYVNFFVFTSLLSVDKVIDSMWNYNVIISIVFVVFILIAIITITNYFISKNKITKRK